MGLLSSGQAMLGRVMAAEGQSITYARGATTLSMTAMPDDSQMLAMTDTGLTIETGEMDFAMDVADLDSLLLPQDRDLIGWSNLSFRVLPSSNGRCYDWLDNRHLRIAVHTKQVPK